MKFSLLAALIAAAPLVCSGQPDETTQAELNVNSRYLVEAVELAPSRYRLSSRRYQLL